MNNVQRIIGPALAMCGIVLLSNILVQYPINHYLTWGAFSYPVAYFVTDACNRWAGARLARQVAWVGFATGLIMSAILAPARIAMASGTAFLVSQFLDISIFNQLRQRSWWKAPFIGSLIASVVDTGIFFGMAFGGTDVPWVPLAGGDLMVKWGMAALLLVPFRAIVRVTAGPGGRAQARV